MGLTKKQRSTLFAKYDGKCAYCGCDLGKRWHADHIEPVGRINNGTMLHPENDVYENYNPACASCNINKYDQNIEQWRSAIGKYIDTLNTTSPYKAAKRFGLIAETGAKVEFYFERLEKSSTGESNCTIDSVSKRFWHFDCWNRKGELDTITIEALNAENATIIFKAKHEDLGFDPPY